MVVCRVCYRTEIDRLTLSHADGAATSIRTEALAAGTKDSRKGTCEHTDMHVTDMAQVNIRLATVPWGRRVCLCEAQYTNTHWSLTQAACLQPYVSSYKLERAKVWILTMSISALICYLAPSKLPHGTSPCRQQWAFAWHTVIVRHMF